MECPKTKQDLANHIAQDTGSMFAPPQPQSISPSMPSNSKEILGGCTGNTQALPKTEKNDNNVEVMSAWRTITSNPKYKQNVDMNELCSEFATKARCDGHKVVIEPTSMQQILDAVSQKQQN